MTISNKIVLTRPVAQAQPLAKRLNELGYSVELFPLLEISSLPENSEAQRVLKSTLANLASYALAVFVSPNAIHAVFKNGMKWPAEVPIAVMGEGSRAALVQYGIDDTYTRIFCPPDPLHSDSESLLRELDLTALQGREVVIFRAETGRELLPDALTEKGIRVVKVAAYRRIAAAITTQRILQLSALLATGADWVIASSEAVRTLREMISKMDSEQACVVAMQQTNILVSHSRIAETAEKCGFQRIQQIASGDENLLLALQCRST